jgi:hypothetical protein
MCRPRATIDQVGDDRRRRRPLPRAAALEHRLADEVASIATALNTPSIWAIGASSGTMQGCTRCSMPYGVSRARPEQLDAVAQLLGEADVHRRCTRGCPRHDAGEIDLGAERRAGQHRELVRGIDAVDVEAGIGLGVARRLRLGQHDVEVAAGLAHGAQDVVAGAVEDAVEARTRLPTRPSRSALMIGMPPATAASKARMRRASRPARELGAVHARAAPCWR